ncbi:MAG: agmatine deiminase family protein [Candidatus Marinimicrobia bacterium]|jgi:agmatine/peptidylarginine deiminase|nr:agmatine deiminase family protein [Candidatus Neomarinimicrobiota bacterium]
MFVKKYIVFAFLTVLIAEIPEYRVVAEWEPALGTIIRWPLGIPSDLVIELASEDILYVLVETNNQQSQAANSFNSWGVNIDNVAFIDTDTYSHWTRDHGPQFVIGEDYWKVVNQQFNGYPVENGCEFECDEEMILFDCVGTELCNNQPQYASEGYDCYINNDLCEDFNSDGQIMDWLGDGYCDDGGWGLDFQCDEYSWDCGDCGGTISDENGYCDDDLMAGNRNQIEGRPLPSESRGWDEDDDTNIDFANQMNWDIQNLPLYWTGGNFMTDGYGMGFSTELMVNENSISNEAFIEIMNEELYFSDYHIFDNPNEESIQHIDCLAKLVGPEAIIIKQVPESSPEYECMEDFADSFYALNTFYDRPFKIHRILCPEINGGSWETNPVAAYTNSLILNNKVLVPQYGISEDSEAIQTYRDAMPGYEIIGFDDTFGNPWYAEDALHCRTMGVFDPHMIHISHKSIRSEDLIHNGAIYIESEILDYGNADENVQSVALHWKYSAEDGPFGEIALELESDNMYTGAFPALNSNSSIDYFLTATNSSGNAVSHPNAGWHTFNTLEFMLGDINGDNSINIQDIVLAVNLVLSGEYNFSADINSDNTVDILDIVQLVNIILN